MRGRFEGMENTVLVNGRRVDFASTTLNVFELQKQLREDDAFLEELRKVNLTAADVRKIGSILEAGPEEIRLSRSSLEREGVFFFNDLSKDRRYRMFARSLEPFRGPVTQLPMVRANYLTRILVVDPLSAPVETLQGCYELLLQGYPVRLGLVLFSPAGARALREERGRGRVGGG